MLQVLIEYSEVHNSTTPHHRKRDHGQ